MKAKFYHLKEKSFYYVTCEDAIAVKNKLFDLCPSYINGIPVNPKACFVLSARIGEHTHHDVIVPENEKILTTVFAYEGITVRIDEPNHKEWQLEICGGNIEQRVSATQKLGFNEQIPVRLNYDNKQLESVA